MAMAVKLFDTGRRSSGQAADLADLPRVHFLYELGRWGVSALQIGEDELESDLNVARSLHGTLAQLIGDVIVPWEVGQELAAGHAKDTTLQQIQSHPGIPLRPTAVTDDTFNAPIHTATKPAVMVKRIQRSASIASSVRH